MPFIVDADGTITTYQGDTGELVINGIPNDQNYKLFFAVQDKKRNIIGNEIMVNSLQKDSVAITVNADLTNLLEVPMNKTFETYYYGVKLCTPGTLSEDTLFISNGNFATQNKIIVYPKKVEGIL
ncbi:MAG: hypothetical protein BHW55_00205 [Candidatus Melainabacteria bacterium 35_41]|nr:MAG: hypothetical protein BHW55_00205 [Candidatus Melainabacteria bacterium 35_41]